VATTKNRAFIDYFTKLQKGRGKERGIKTKMRVNVDAKMLIISWTLLGLSLNPQPGLGMIGGRTRQAG
jgi:hypothetical protein